MSADYVAIVDEIIKTATREELFLFFSDSLRSDFEMFKLISIKYIEMYDDFSNCIYKTCIEEKFDCFLFLIDKGNVDKDTYLGMMITAMQHKETKILEVLCDKFPVFFRGVLKSIVLMACVVDKYNYLKCVITKAKFSKEEYIHSGYASRCLNTDAIKIIIAYSNDNDPLSADYFGDPDVKKIVDEYNQNPNEVKKMMRMELNITTQEASIFALVIFACDGLLDVDQVTGF